MNRKTYQLCERKTEANIIKLSILLKGQEEKPYQIFKKYYEAFIIQFILAHEEADGLIEKK